MIKAEVYYQPLRKTFNLFQALFSCGNFMGQFSSQLFKRCKIFRHHELVNQNELKFFINSIDLQKSKTCKEATNR